MLAALAVLAGTVGQGLAASLAAPANTAAPTIAGTAQVDATLTATPGTWSGGGSITYQYLWRRCAKNGGSCSGIGGATSSDYQLKNVDAGNTPQVRVTATNADGSTPARPRADRRRDGHDADAGAGALDRMSGQPGRNGAGRRRQPARAAHDRPAAGLPSTITPGSRALTARFHVSACGASVQGALVYVTAVPYGQFAIPNEQPTGADGWATLDFEALKGFPVSKAQRLLVMFVRARKSGDNILGGISTRRVDRSGSPRNARRRGVGHDAPAPASSDGAVDTCTSSCDCRRAASSTSSRSGSSSCRRRPSGNPGYGST